ncbi:MAG: hypothetical protein GX561_02160 [Lentisphaerae bacterium]|nr:hypothetical protein [Lentisphaerota bacterium]
MENINNNYNNENPREVKYVASIILGVILCFSQMIAKGKKYFEPKKAVETGFNSQLTDYQTVRKFIHFTMQVN